MRHTIALILLLLPTLCFSQIKVPDIGEGWKAQVDSAIALVKATSPESYDLLIDNCKEIEYIIGDYSTTKPPHIIAINTRDLQKHSINNIAAILVHESYHLYLYNIGAHLDPNFEELVCYRKEYTFLCKLPYVEDWLFRNAINQIISYSSVINTHR
jgi:hypothetical protein